MHLRARHAERRGDRGARVSSPEVIVFRFCSAQEFRHAAALADGLEIFSAARQHLVRVALMTNVEDQSVRRRIEYVVNRRDQLDGPETGSQMPAGLRNPREDLLPNIFRDLLNLISSKLAQVRGPFNSVKKRSFRLL